MNHIQTFIILTFLCSASITSAIISPALPVMAQDFGISLSSINLVNSLFLFGYMIGQLFYGPISNRYGALTALRSGLTLMLLGIGLCIIGVELLQYPLFLIGRFFSALGAASGLCCTFMLITQLLNKEDAGQAMTFAPLFFTFGIGFSALIGGWITQHFSWQVIFYALLGYVTTQYLASFALPRPEFESKPINFDSLISGYSTALKSKQLCLFALCVGLASIVAYGSSASAPIFAIQTLKLSSQNYGVWNLLNMFGMGGSSLISAMLMKKIGPKKLLQVGLTGLLLSTICLGFLANVSHPAVTVFFVITACMYLSSGLIFPAASFIASQAISDKSSSASMISFINIGSAFVTVFMIGYMPLAIINNFILILLVAMILTIIGTNLYCFPAEEAKEV